MPSGRDWILLVGGNTCDRAATREAVTGKRARFWIRNRRGRALQARNERTGETWSYRGRGWVLVTPARGQREPAAADEPAPAEQERLL